MLYQDVLSRNKAEEARANVLIVPTGNILYAKNGGDIIHGLAKSTDIYRPINELKIAHHVPVEFFVEMSAMATMHKAFQFKQQNLAIFGRDDEDTDPDFAVDIKQHNVSRRMMLHDNHRMMNSMGTICEITKSFVLANQ